MTSIAQQREALERRWERMRDRLDDFAAGMEARRVLARDLQAAIDGLNDVEWTSSDQALKRVEELARELRLTDRALVELKHASSHRSVRQFLLVHLISAHLRAIDDEAETRPAVTIPVTNGPRRQTVPVFEYGSGRVQRALPARAVLNPKVGSEHG